MQMASKPVGAGFSRALSCKGPRPGFCARTVTAKNRIRSEKTIRFNTNQTPVLIAWLIARENRSANEGRGREFNEIQISNRLYIVEFQGLQAIKHEYR